jgi:integrase
MSTFSAGPGVLDRDPRVLHAAVAAYLGRYRGASRVHTGSDLNIFLAWCDRQDLDPLAAGRVDIERYVRWLQDVRRYQPSTVSRRLSIVVGFYRVCVIDCILPASPADYVRRPAVPPESPTLGLGRLQFEALLTTARLSPNANDFALIAMLGLLGLRIFEACAAGIDDLGEEHGHRVLRVCGKGGKGGKGGLAPLPPAVARAIDHAVEGRDHGPVLRNSLGRRMDRHAATRRAAPGRLGRDPDAADAPAQAPTHICHDDARCRGEPARRTDRRTPRRSAHHDALRPGPQEPRPPVSGTLNRHHSGTLFGHHQDRSRSNEANVYEQDRHLVSLPTLTESPRSTPCFGTTR